MATQNTVITVVPEVFNWGMKSQIRMKQMNCRQALYQFQLLDFFSTGANDGSLPKETHLWISQLSSTTSIHFHDNNECNNGNRWTLIVHIMKQRNIILHRQITENDIDKWILPGKNCFSNYHLQSAVPNYE